MLNLAGAVAQALGWNSHSVQHGQEQIIQRSSIRIDRMDALVNCAASTPCHQNWKIVMVVAITVTNASTVDNHRVVQKRSLRLLDCMHFLENVAELGNVELIDDCFLFKLIRVSAVVRHIMVPLGYADSWVAPVASFVRKHERCHASEVSLERQNHHVAHEANVVRIIMRDPRWNSSSASTNVGGGPVKLREPLLDFSHRGEIFVQLLLISVAELRSQAAGIFHYEVEHAVVVPGSHQSTFDRFVLVTLSKQPLKHQPRINLLGHRSCLTAPGDVA